ncbi:Spo0E family sporulation regulatory protein-aspartic acid phosphatase [Cohnella sp.]|uniref:Spo0E family sporulation regulatory protein-aspartic acid phosphatase n=1 Tax=Cohnella sp. TaxID=1883426 RepID=UPI00356A1811
MLKNVEITIKILLVLVRNISRVCEEFRKGRAVVNVPATVNLDLIKSIEELRIKMNQVGSELNVMSEELISLSQKLDVLIFEYHSTNYNSGKHTSQTQLVEQQMDRGI